MGLWILMLFIVQYSYGFQMRETEYECGAHGRFEYCIDGVAGCVIGCHCHPGYYFDTDTKICEPNIRLSQNFRRNYDVEPTRVFIPATPPVITEPATTAKNAVNEKIDIITKDADDLGDWLYNQFFKTIENQVINETKDEPIITRRSESAPTFIRKPTRRSHRYWKARRKKKKKKKGLRSKLLRITEDDSLFDSSSSSSSTSGDSSDSSSSGANTSEESREKTKERKEKSDHGHKKIVVLNKRPKPPLPSFIFLPNMETPFFPPIGLPPPPMPMYPMVPVPPMMGPFTFPAATPTCESETKKNENGGTEASQTDKMPSHPTEKPSNYKPPDNKPPDDKPSDDKPPDANPSDNKPPDDKLPDDTLPDENLPDENLPDENLPDDKPPDDTQPDETPPNENPPNFLRKPMKKRRGPRNKLMQKLREKLKRKNKMQHYFANEYQGLPGIPPGFIAHHLPNLRHKPLPEINVEEELAGLQDVDFKYLSQLIHIADLNKTKHSQTTTTPATQIKNTLTVPLNSRRNFYENYPNQITKVLSDLVNQPMNYVPEEQLNDGPLNESYHIPNQPTYNTPNQQTYNAPNQPTYNAPNQHTYTIPNQPTYSAPNKPTYNIPNQPTYNVPNQPTYNAPSQPFYNLPNHPSNNAPKQPSYNLQNQPTYVSLNQPSPKIPYRKKIEDSNDIYFSNLGRQIASMIRNIDGDKEVDIEIKSSLNTPNNPVIPGHSGPQSYWERSVRSPYKHIMTSHKKEINNLKLSNENLFILENKVEIAASTKPTLSLHDLENIISKMQKAKTKFIQRNKSSQRATKSSKSSFNVNLLPGNDQQFYSKRRHNKRAQNILLKPPQTNNVVNIANTETPKLNVHPLLEPLRPRSSMLRDFLFPLQVSHEISNKTTPKTNTFQTNTYVSNVIPTKKTDSVPASQFVYKMPNPYFNFYAYTVLPLPAKPPPPANMRPHNVQTTTNRTYYQQLSPMVLKHKSLKYYGRITNNQYMYENQKASMPLKPQSYSSSQIAPARRYVTFTKRLEPSYFHHELHHFDYFDDI